MPKGTKIITLQRWIEDEEERRGYKRTKTCLWREGPYIISDHGRSIRKACSYWAMKRMRIRSICTTSHDLSFPILYL